MQLLKKLSAALYSADKPHNISASLAETYRTYTQLERNPMKDEMLRKRQSELQILYLRNMTKIKWRYNAITDIMTRKRTSTYQTTNIEFCVLQFRKILELIALSSLISDADVYRVQLGKIEKMWNARNILRDIERIHPHFYPQPINVLKHENSDNEFVKKTTPYLTKDKFENTYARCGKYLHEFSPFKSEAEIEHAYKEIMHEFPKWSYLIVELLSTHIVHLYDSRFMFYISMGAKNDPPRGNIFQMLDE